MNLTNELPKIITISNGKYVHLRKDKRIKRPSIWLTKPLSYEIEELKKINLNFNVEDNKRLTLPEINLDGVDTPESSLKKSSLSQRTSIMSLSSHRKRSSYKLSLNNNIDKRHSSVSSELNYEINIARRITNKAFGKSMINSVLKCSRVIKFILLIVQWVKFVKAKGEENISNLLSVAQINDEAGKIGNVALLFDRAVFKAQKERKLPIQAIKILQKPPNERSHKELKYLNICLMFNKEFSECPSKIKLEICKCAWYETYGSKRALVKEGHFPLAYYIILSGNAVVTQNDTKTNISRTIGFISAGKGFGELAITHKCKRTASVVSKSEIELLCLSVDDYTDIFMFGGSSFYQAPHIKAFLEQIPFLKNWHDKTNPDYTLQQSLSLLTPLDFLMRYFNKSRIICEDSKTDDWIYLIKGGSVQVLTLLSYKQTLNQNQNPLNPPLSERQFNNQNANLWKDLCHIKYNQTTNPPEMIHPNNLYFYNNIDAIKANWTKLKYHHNFSFIDDITEMESYIPGTKNPFLKIHQVNYDYVMDNLNGKFVDENFDINSKSSVNYLWVKIQTLESGDYFGFHELLFENQPNLTLVSNGAECIMLSKKELENRLSQATWNMLMMTEAPYPNYEEMNSCLNDLLVWHQVKPHLTKRKLN